MAVLLVIICGLRQALMLEVKFVLTTGCRSFTITNEKSCHSISIHTYVQQASGHCIHMYYIVKVSVILYGSA